jgi:hypothetical protein
VKADLEIVEGVLSSHAGIDPAVRDQVLQQIMAEMEAAAAEAAATKEPKISKQFVVIVSDPLGQIRSDLVAWVCQIEEEQSPATVTQRLAVARRDYSRTKAGHRNLRDNSVGEAMEVVPGRFCKEVGLWVKTKEPVQVITTDNRLPKVGEGDAIENRPVAEQGELPGAEVPVTQPKKEVHVVLAALCDVSVAPVNRAPVEPDEMPPQYFDAAREVLPWPNNPHAKRELVNELVGLFYATFADPCATPNKANLQRFRDAITAAPQFAARLIRPA